MVSLHWKKLFQINGFDESLIHLFIHKNKTRKKKKKKNKVISTIYIMLVDLHNLDCRHILFISNAELHLISNICPFTFYTSTNLKMTREFHLCHILYHKNTNLSKNIYK